MRSLRTKLTATTLLAASAITLSGCNNAFEGGLSGAGLGAAAGAIIGSLSGAAGDGAAIGAVVGGLGGAVIGDQNRRNAAYASGPPPVAYSTTYVYPAPVYYAYPAPTTYYYIGGSSCNTYRRGCNW